MAEGLANKKGFRYVLLTVTVKMALARLRRLMAGNPGSVSAEDSSTVRREGRSTYAHIPERCAAYGPGAVA